MIKKSTSKTRSAELNLRVVKFQEEVEKYTGKHISSSEGDIVAFVGPTKAGKSTLINFIAGNELICKQDRAFDTYYFEKPPGTEGPEIGEAGESHTSCPEKCQTIPNTSYDMWDFPGFGDNKGTEQEISNAVCYEAVLRPQKSVRFVLVAPFEMISSSDPMPFYKLLNELKEICPNIDKSLCIVISKFDRGSLKEILKRIVRYDFNNTNSTNSRIVNEGKKLITTILDNSNYIEFNTPKDGDATFNNKNQLIRTIKKLEGVKISEFPLVISDQAKNEILELYTSFYEELKNDVKKTNRLLEKFFQTSFDEVSQISNAQSKYDLLKKTKDKINEIIKCSSNFDKFFKTIEKNGFGIEKFADCLKKFIFIEKLKNRYNAKKSSSTKETDFFDTIIETLKRCLNTCKDLMKTVKASLDEIEEIKQSIKKRDSSPVSKPAPSSSNTNTGISHGSNEETPSLLVEGAKLLDRVIKTVFNPPIFGPGDILRK